MEESLHKLTSFFQEITYFETEIDGLRAKLSSISNAHKIVFQAVDQECCGEITSNEICELCNERGFHFSHKFYEIVGRYFHSESKAIKFPFFSQLLTPKYITTQSLLTHETDPINIFVKIIDTIAKAYQKLECLRSGLTDSCHFIMDYFDHYGENLGLTIHNLRRFMVDRKIYTKTNFCQISGYIFGVDETCLDWNVFLKIEKEQQTIEESTVFELKSVDQLLNRSERNIFKQNSKMRECGTIHEVISDTLKIEKSLKGKRMRTQTSVDLLKINEEENSFHYETQKLLSFKVKANELKRKGCLKHSNKIKKRERLSEFEEEQEKNIPNTFGKNMIRHTFDESTSPTDDPPITFLWFPKEKNTIGSGNFDKRSSSQNPFRMKENEGKGINTRFEERKSFYYQNEFLVPNLNCQEKPNFELFRKNFFGFRELENYRKIGSPEENPYSPIYSNQGPRLLRNIRENKIFVRY